jgi:streptogramin lyase
VGLGAQERCVIALAGLALALQIQAGPPTWTLSASPVLTIEDDGTAAKEFVRVVGVARLSNGSIAVANRGTNDIRIFDARGRHITTFGRAGEGPGEFRRLEMIGRTGDTAWFYDSGVQRITAVLLGAKPELLGTTRVTATGKRENYSVTGRLSDGRWVATTNVSPTFEGPPGVHRLPGSTGIIARTGDGDVNWLGEYKSAAIFVHNPTGDYKQASVGPTAFPPWLRSVTSGAQVWIGDSGGDSLIVVRARDLSRFVVRLPMAGRAPSRGLVDSARAQEMALNQSPQGKAFTEAKYSSKFLPERLPSFESLLAGPQGEIWVQAYAGDRAAPTYYVILDANGRPKGRVPVPGGSRIREVGLDYAILVHENEDGVESVRIHRLERK